MTVTSPSSRATVKLPAQRRGATARRAATAPRRAARAVAALAMVAAFVLGSTLGATASPATAAPSPSPSPHGALTFTLAPSASGVVRPGDALVATLNVSNGTAVAVAGGPASLAIGDAAITDRAALQKWLAGDGDELRTHVIATTALPALSPDSQTSVGVFVPATDPSLATRPPGVYPLLARYERVSGTVTSTSVLIVPAATAQTRPVGVLVPITAPPLSAGLLTAAQLTTLTAPDGLLTQQLDAVTGTDAILAVDPAVPAAIRVLGASAPATAVTWLARLQTLPNSRFALQFGDADVAAQLHAGLTAPLEPLSLRSYMAAADFPTATATPVATPTPTPAPPTPAFPTLATLLDVGGGRAGTYWPLGASATAADVAALGRLGTSPSAGLTLIPSATTKTGADGAAVPARGSVRDAGVLVYDSLVSAQLQLASGMGDDSTALRGAPLAAAMAQLQLALRSAGDWPLLVTVDRANARTRAALQAAIRDIEGAPGVRSATLGDLVSAAPAAVEVGATAADTARAAATVQLRAGETSLTAFATVLDDPTLITDPERAQLLQLLGGAWLADAPAWQKALSAHADATAKTLGAVGILPPSPLNLISSSSGLPFRVRNDLPYPVTVWLIATPDDLRLDVQRATQVRVSPLSNTRVDVPVQARIGSGDVAVRLRLQSVAGVHIGEPQTADVRVRAEWEGIGVTALLVLVAALLTVGVTRTLLTRRRMRRTAAPEASDEPLLDVDAHGAPALQPRDPHDAPAPERTETP